mgnify:CR=1 FL=1
MPESFAELAREAIADITPAATIGELIGVTSEEDGTVTVRFTSVLAGYPGGVGTASLMQVDGEDATVLEVVGPDSLGLLYRLTRAMADLNVDVRTAKIQTIGADVVDAFYVVSTDGSKIVDPDHQGEIRRALLHALEPGG